MKMIVVAALLAGAWLPASAKLVASRIYVDKSDRLLHVYSGKKRIASFRMALGCVFRAKLDTHSTPNWTPIPRQTGHPFQRKLDTDSAPNWTVWRGLREQAARG